MTIRAAILLPLLCIASFVLGNEASRYVARSIYGYDPYQHLQARQLGDLHSYQRRDVDTYPDELYLRDVADIYLDDLALLKRDAIEAIELYLSARAEGAAPLRVRNDFDINWDDTKSRKVRDLYEGEIQGYLSAHPSHQVMVRVNGNWVEQAMTFNHAKVMGGYHESKNKADPYDSKHVNIRLWNDALGRGEKYYVLHWRPTLSETVMLPHPMPDYKQVKKQEKEDKKKDKKGEDKATGGGGSISGGGGGGSAAGGGAATGNRSVPKGKLPSVPGPKSPPRGRPGKP